MTSSNTQRLLQMTKHKAEEMMDAINRLELDINRCYDMDGKFTHIEVASGSFKHPQVVYCGTYDGMQTIEEAVSYILDMEKLGKEFAL